MNLKTELELFFRRTGVTQSSLARASGVPASTISFLLNGKRRDVAGRNLDALRLGMKKILASLPRNPPQGGA